MYMTNIKITEKDLKIISFNIPTCPLSEWSTSYHTDHANHNDLILLPLI